MTEHTERERENVGEVVRETLHLRGGGQETLSPVSKVPRQCPLVLLVEVCLTEGEAFKDCRKEFEPRF
jgi:hypothetical protein